MAGKSGDKVKKGFAFYLVMLLLLLVAAFLIIVMVMLFSPGKPILGLVYFNSDEKPITQTIIDQQELDFSKIDKVVVNSNYANVLVTKSDDDQSQDCIKIDNHAKGFAKQSSFSKFEYSASLFADGGKNVLTISVKEPEAFLYFSKNITIEVSVSKASEQNFLTTEFEINTNSGLIRLGNKGDDKNGNVQVSKVSAHTKSGNIEICTLAQDETAGMKFDSLMLYTDSGKILAEKNMEIENDASFTVASKGRIELKNVIAKKGLAVTLNNGTLTGEYVTGDVTVSDFQKGTAKLDSVWGTFKAEDAQNGSIELGQTKEVVIGAKKTKVKIGKIEALGQARVHTESGSIQVDQFVGKIFDFQTVSGNINVVIAQNELYGEYQSIKSETGNVNLKYVDKVINVVEVHTRKNVEVTLPNNSQFTLNLNTFDQKPIEKLGSNVVISFIDNSHYQYPLKVNDQAGPFDDTEFVNNQLKIFADGKIYVHLP